MSYTWYDCELSCGHKVRWSDFEPIPPRVGGGKWCGTCRMFAVIKSVSEHAVDVDDIEEMPA